VATRIDVGGVNTWTEVRGSGDATVVLLHGGLSNSDDLLDSIGVGLEEHFRLIAFDRRGHGYTPDTEEPFHYDDMATHAIAVLEHFAPSKPAPGASSVTDAASPVHLIGWSDGGIVALLVALRRPDLVDRLVVIGTNFHFDGLHEFDASDDPSGGAMAEAYAARSPDGAEHFQVVAEKFMITTEPTLTPAELGTLRHPTLVLVGDDDMVRLDHTVAFYEALPAGRLCVLPGASHAVVLERPQLVTDVVADFLMGPEPPDTIVPIRRRRARSS
jgi:pimeloyl-ACP methyl ester carboxylesterase